jgi:hypothetical protein
MVLISRAGRFVLALVLGLAVITWAGSLLVERTTRDWFERDITLRAHLRPAGPARACSVVGQAGTRPPSRSCWAT